MSDYIPLKFVGYSVIISDNELYPEKIELFGSAVLPHLRNL